MTPSGRWDLSLTAVLVTLEVSGIRYNPAWTRLLAMVQTVAMVFSRIVNLLKFMTQWVSRSRAYSSTRTSQNFSTRGTIEVNFEESNQQAAFYLPRSITRWRRAWPRATKISPNISVSQWLPTPWTAHVEACVTAKRWWHIQIMCSGHTVQIFSSQSKPRPAHWKHHRKTLSSRLSLATVVG